MGKSIITPGVTYAFGNGVKGDCVVVELHNKPAKGVTGEKTGGNVLKGLIAQNVTGAIQKQPRQFYEIGTNKYYFVEARPSGSGSIDHIVGPNKKDLWATIEKFADVCYETDLKMGVKPACKLCIADSNPGTIVFKCGMLNSIQVTATANDWVLTSRLGFTFYDLQYPNNKSGGNARRKTDSQDGGWQSDGGVPPVPEIVDLNAD